MTMCGRSLHHGNTVNCKNLKKKFGLTTEYRATFEGLSHSSGSSVDFKVYYSVNSYVLPPGEVFGPSKVIIIMPQVYALPYSAHTERISPLIYEAKQI